MSAKMLKEIVRPVYRRAVDALPPRTHLMLDFLRFHHRFPNIDNPQTLNEKILCRKLYDRDPRLPVLVDKVRAKDYVAQKFGKDLVIPTLAVYDSADQMDFSQEPLSKPPYVLKVNHGSGFNIFVKEKPADPEVIRRKLAAQLATDYADIMEEWAYSEVPRKILVEPLIEVLQGYIPDYKCHTFNGKLFAIEMIIDRFGSYEINLYDRDWKQFDVRVYAKRPRHDGPIAPPARLAEIVKLAEALGDDFPYVRVDLYEINEQVKFGEMTFYPGGGHDRFDPPEWDEIFGKQWKQDFATLARGR